MYSHYSIYTKRLSQIYLSIDMSANLPHYQSPRNRRQLSTLEWEGLRSSRFGRTIHFLPAKDLIKTNFEMPDQSPTRGRLHLAEKNSFEQQYRPIARKVPQIEHWHLRESKIKTMQFKPSQPAARRQRRHNNQISCNPESSALMGLRTFYFANKSSFRQYSVQNTMQRKIRINQSQMRNSFYKDMQVFKKY